MEKSGSAIGVTPVWTSADITVLPGLDEATRQSTAPERLAPPRPRVECGALYGERRRDARAPDAGAVQGRCKKPDGAKLRPAIGRHSPAEW